MRIKNEQNKFRAKYKTSKGTFTTYGTKEEVQKKLDAEIKAGARVIQKPTHYKKLLRK